MQLLDAETPPSRAAHTTFLANGKSVSYSMHLRPSVGYNPLFDSLLGTGTQNSDCISSVSDVRVTPSFELQGVAKGGKTGKDGRVNSAVAYYAAKHTALLT